MIHFNESDCAVSMTCPKCGKLVSVTLAHDEATIKCPCGEIITIDADCKQKLNAIRVLAADQIAPKS